jgi:hypothetical protein
MFQFNGSYALFSYHESNVSYYLDGKIFCPINLENESVVEKVNKGYSILLMNLTYGEHKIQVKGESIASYFRDINTRINFESATVSFYIKQPEQLSGNPFSSMAMLLSGVIAGAVIVSVALLVIYRKQYLKRKDKLTAN